MHAGLRAASRRNAITAIERPFNWAVRLGYPNGMPLGHIEMPRVQRREQAVTPEEYVRIRDHYPLTTRSAPCSVSAGTPGARPMR